MPTLPSRPWSPGLPERGNMGRCLCVSVSHQSHNGEEDADSCEPSFPGLGAQAERLPSPGQGWVLENAAFPQVCPSLLPPDLPCLPLAPLVLCSLATVFILKGPQKWGPFLSIPWGMERLCLPEPRHRSLAGSSPLAPPVLPVY